MKINTVFLLFCILTGGCLAAVAQDQTNVEVHEVTDWRLNRLTGAYTAQLDPDSVSPLAYLVVHVIKNDALFIDDQFVSHWQAPASDTLYISELVKYARHRPMTLKYITDPLNLSERPVAVKVEVSRLPTPLERYRLRPSLPVETGNRVLLVFVLLLCLIMIKYLFPLYFRVMINPLQHEITTNLVSNFRNGAVVISAVISSVIFSYFIYLRFDIDFIMAGVVFLAILLFYALKFLLAVILSGIFRQQEVLNSVFFDWMINVVRLSVLMIIAYLVAVFLEVEVLYLTREALLISLLIPLVSVTFSLFKNINSLSLNHLFFYLCALEITPMVILIKVL